MKAYQVNFEYTAKGYMTIAANTPEEASEGAASMAKDVPGFKVLDIEDLTEVSDDVIVEPMTNTVN